MKRGILYFLSILIIVGCSNVSEITPIVSSEEKITSSNSSATQSSSIPELGKNTLPSKRIVLLDELDEKARNELIGFLERLKEDASEKTYCYLFVVNEFGNPVANIQCYANESDFLSMRVPDFDYRIGLSRNSGLLPIKADFLEPTLYLCNRDIAVPYYERPVIQQVDIDEETLEQMREGKILQVVWGEEAPSETILSVNHINVTVKDANGNPVANHVVYIHYCWEDTQPKAEYGDIGFGDTFYEPRYTDANGVARFVMDNTFRPEGDREVVVIPSYEEPKSPKKKAVRLRVGDEPPSEFEVTLD